jgi:hypothetical protein
MSMTLPEWTLKGELILNCNCTVFCPCVVSLGKHPPTEGYCQAWVGVRIDEGHYDGESLGGLNVGLINIFSGKARGTTGLFAVMVSEFLGAERSPVSYETEGKTRRLVVGKKINGAVTPISGKDPNSEVVVSNTEYWMGPDITIAQADKGRVRAFGRVWDFDGRSAEICQIDWHGPK